MLTIRYIFVFESIGCLALQYMLIYFMGSEKKCGRKPILRNVQKSKEYLRITQFVDVAGSMMSKKQGDKNEKDSHCTHCRLTGVCF